MAAELRAIEVSGTVDADGRLALDEPLRAVPPGRVRLIVLAPGDGTANAPSSEDAPPTAGEHSALDYEEREWLQAAARSPAFALLADPAEDVYSATDGRPFHDAG